MVQKQPRRARGHRDSRVSSESESDSDGQLTPEASPSPPSTPGNNDGSARHPGLVSPITDSDSDAHPVASREHPRRSQAPTPESEDNSSDDNRPTPPSTRSTSKAPTLRKTIISSGEEEEDNEPPPRPSRKSSATSQRAKSAAPSRYKAGTANRRPPRPTKTSGEGAEFDSGDETVESQRKRYEERQQRQPSSIGSPWRALKRSWRWFWGWEGWILVRAYIAIPIALTISCLMLAIGATGPAPGITWWWFCISNDIKLGGIGYCQG
ncbi:hypothetical protein BD324DRAFT_7587 [Kockovaella imperatae]|uniref:Uncharacterized protein n=1 Tax=Kockovaella imperatae TaxID=4999 RepID=A0A1Y1UR93_9TREE|nr:hypothetical protein BD324DRAFT_7587 [Kockovaella imperatae]ORX40560.1 hypothetical protein BD324DRAFT_7587 [Kockovaella imperatae]